MELEIYGGPKHGGWSGHGEYEPGIDTPLRACPFCGGSNVTVTNTHTPYYGAECEDCGAEGPRPNTGAAWKRGMSKAAAERLHREAFQAAVDAWNERAGH